MVGARHDTSIRTVAGPFDGGRDEASGPMDHLVRLTDEVVLTSPNPQGRRTMRPPARQRKLA